MNFMVTGGAGFIGSHIAQELLKLPDANVTIFDNLSVGKQENIPEGCDFVKGDIRDPRSIGKAMLAVDVVLHNAAFVSIRGSFTKLEDDLENNCRGTLVILREAAKRGVKKFIFASSMAIYGEPKALPVSEDDVPNPISPYGLSKLRGEMYTRLFAEEGCFEHVILRYFNTYGCCQTPSDYVGVITAFTNMALKGNALAVYGDGSQTRDFVWVKDVAQANVLAATHDVTGTFNVGSGLETSINTLADMILQEIGGKKEYHPRPLGEISRIRADISRVHRTFGYNPVGRLEKELPEIIEYWRHRLCNNSSV